MKRYFIVIAVSIIAISCDDENITSPSPIVNLMNLKVGNYWVYDWYEVNITSGVVTNLNKRDSIIIEKDSIINDRTYYVKSNNYLGNVLRSKTLVFDSLSTLYTYPDREIVLTLTKSMEVTKKIGPKDNPIAIGYYSIEDSRVNIQVPAGTFLSLNFRGRIESQQSDYPYGIRYNDNFYSENIGLVKVRTYNYSSPNDLEMRLLRHGRINVQ